jgi:hypothetical protein
MVAQLSKWIAWGLREAEQRGAVALRRPGKQITIHACNWHTPCCVMAVRIETTTYPETPMNTLSSKFTAFAAALVMNSLIMGAVGYLFEIQSHPQMSVIAFAKAVAAHQWLI